MIFSINSSIFLFSPIFLFFIVGQMVPTICSMPMMNNTNSGNDTISQMNMPSNSNESTLDHPMNSSAIFNFISRLDDQNRALLGKFLEFDKELAPEMGSNGTQYLSNETLAELKEMHHELFDAIDEDKDGNLTRQEQYLYGMEVVLPYMVEIVTKNMTSAQREQYLANLNANMEVKAKANLDEILDKVIEKFDQNGDGILTKKEVDMKLDEMANNANNDGYPMTRDVLMMKANFL